METEIVEIVSSNITDAVGNSVTGSNEHLTTKTNILPELPDVCKSENQKVIDKSPESVFKTPRQNNEDGGINMPVFGHSSKSSGSYSSETQIGKLLVEQATLLDPSIEGNNEPSHKKKKYDLYTTDEGPCIYSVKGKLVTPPLITKNLPKQFEGLPIYGRPESKAKLHEFFRNKIKDFIGEDLDDQEFYNLSKYCSPVHLKTGVELSMSTNVPTHGIVLRKLDERQKLPKAELEEGINLCIHKKHQLRKEKDVNNIFPLKLKYRGVRMIPLADDEKAPVPETPEALIEPGKDLIFRVRVYRPFTYNMKYYKTSGRMRHSVFNCDVVLAGKNTLAQLRDRIVCPNDVGMRVDVSNNPDELPATSAKDVFPSGFLFINNVFYVDSRAGCADVSGGVRAWAAARGLGRFPVRDLCAATLDQLVLRLGHPEVYMHQGSCEHLFTFSEVRLAGPRDPLRLRSLPAHTAASQHQTVYCTTCAEFGAKWLVAGCERVPFDPAYLCDICFRLYLYRDGRKVADFKAYSYRGNELNLIKPHT